MSVSFYQPNTSFEGVLDCFCWLIGRGPKFLVSTITTLITWLESAQHQTQVQTPRTSQWSHHFQKQNPAEQKSIHYLSGNAEQSLQVRITATLSFSVRWTVVQWSHAAKVIRNWLGQEKQIRLLWWQIVKTVLCRTTRTTHPNTFLLQPPPACFTTERSKVEASLFVQSGIKVNSTLCIYKYHEKSKV